MSRGTGFKNHHAGRPKAANRREFLRALAAGGLVLAASLDHDGRAAENKPRRFDIAIRHRQVAGTQRVLRVTQGETVEIAWTTDEATTVHLHGYDLEATLRPGAPASLIVEARASGRFPISAHGIGRAHGEKTLLYLEVHPR